MNILYFKDVIMLTMDLYDTTSVTDVKINKTVVKSGLAWPDIALEENSLNKVRNCSVSHKQCYPVRLKLLAFLQQKLPIYIVHLKL